MAERMGQPLETLKMQEKKEIRCGHCNKLLGKGTARDLENQVPSLWHAESCEGF